MANILTKGLTKIFGTKSERDLKGVRPLVAKINQEYSTLLGLSGDELRARTQETRATINSNLEEIDNKIKDLQKQVEENPDMDIHLREDIFDKVDRLEESRNKKTGRGTHGGTPYSLCHSKRNRP